MTKDHNYRNKNLLRWAKRAPVCFMCHRRNDGTVVAAHSNSLTDGKGMGIKAHDYRVAFVCYECHTYIDQSKASAEEKRCAWENAHYDTIGWLFDVGALEVRSPE